MKKAKALTKKQRLHLLFDECIHLEQEFRKSGKGWFHYTRGGGIESTFDVLGLMDEYSIYRHNKILEMKNLEEKILQG